MQWEQQTELWRQRQKWYYNENYLHKLQFIPHNHVLQFYKFTDLICKLLHAEMWLTAAFSETLIKKVTGGCRLKDLIYAQIKLEHKVDSVHESVTFPAMPQTEEADWRSAHTHVFRYSYFILRNFERTLWYRPRCIGVLQHLISSFKIIWI